MTPRGRAGAALVAVVVYDGVEPIDIGGTVGVLSMAGRLLPGLRAVTAAERAGPVRCAGGLVVEAAHGFPDAPPSDAMLVTGGPGWRREAANPAMLGFLRAQDPARLGSVCTGALILGAAGLLERRAATTRRAAAGAETDSPLALLAGMGALPRAAQWWTRAAARPGPPAASASPSTAPCTWSAGCTGKKRAAKWRR